MRAPRRCSWRPARCGWYPIYFVEVSSGKFTDATLTTWINQAGTYSLSVTR